MPKVAQIFELESPDDELLEVAHRLESESLEDVLLEVAHIFELESPDEVLLGLEGTTFQGSIWACDGSGKVGCHQFSAPVELGNSGVGRTTSTILGGGGRRGKNNPMMAALTSSLLPLRSSPAPSSSKPSRAMALVRYTNLLAA